MPSAHLPSAVAGFFTLLLLFAATTALSDNIASSREGSPITKLDDIDLRQIKVTAGEMELFITLNNSKAAEDLMKMLPLRLQTIERNRFAKGFRLPQALSSGEPRTRAYEIGGFGYWPEGPDLAIFYDDIYEQTIVEVIPLGKIGEGAEALSNYDGEVVFEAVNEKG